ncbi:MAG: ribosome-associated translation inhibitor RaiA [Clostridia bacterium]
MKIEFIERGYDIGHRLKDLITEKLSKLDRYFEDGSAKVACKEEKKDGARKYKMEITITAKGMMYRSEVFGENMYENIDLALPKIERQIIKARDIKKDMKKALPIDLGFAFLAETPKFEKQEVTKVKTFELETMDAAEAELRLELLDHEFYIFKNIETGTASVIYKRKDGQYGLINTI